MPMTSEQFHRFPRYRAEAGLGGRRFVSMNEVDRFSRMVKVEGASDGCWTWTGALGRNGYGTFVRANGRKTPAHRFVCEQVYGAAGSDMDACHTCDNRKCVNPLHLFWGTRADNMRDCAKKGRNFAPKGEASPSAKLTFAQVCEMRAIWRRGGITKTALGRRFGISSMHVLKIVRGDIRQCA